jgi:hypothetical protein
MNRWITALTKHGNAPETERQKCQNAPWRTFGTSGTACSGQNADFSEPPDNGAGRYAGWTEEARCDLWDERAAIMEFDGGLTREEAEAAAWREVQGSR